MEKYNLIPEQLLREGVIGLENIIIPESCADEVLIFSHSAEYIKKLNQLALSKMEERKTGFPLSAALVLRERMIMQGTIDCALFALKHGAAANVAGGTHHAFHDHGEAFCLYNDIAVAANFLLHKKLIKQALVIDLDVHQGNGTAEILRDEQRVFTLSMHCADNYPGKKEHSDLDVALPKGTGDDAYLDALENSLKAASKKVSADLIFYQSGVDIIAGDKLGKLEVSPAGCALRDEMVADFAIKRGIPTVAVMGGGYNHRLATIVDAHCQTFKVLQKKFFT